MQWQIATAENIETLAHLNRQLNEDEGAEPLPLPEAIDRLTRWLASDYTAILFKIDGTTVAYTLFRPTDPDSEGYPGGVFVRQFLVARDRRRQGIGKRAFQILREEIWPSNCTVLLDTQYDNSRAQEFWRSVGFSEYHLSFKLQD